MAAHEDAVDDLPPTGSRNGRTPFVEPDSAFRVLVEAMSQGAAILEPTGLVAYANPALAGMLRTSAADIAGGTLDRFTRPQDRLALRALVDTGSVEPATTQLLLAADDGSVIPLQLSVSPMRLDGEPAICLVAVDMTERNRVEARLRSLSLTDELTGLYNARGFFAVGEQEIRIAHRQGVKVLVAFADLDGLKAINDTLGHAAGSHALMDVAVILRQTCREADLIARIGGDEFAVLGMIANEADAGRLPERIQEQIEHHNRDAGRAYTIGISVGTVVTDGTPPVSIASLLQQADMAMYEHKRTKPGHAGIGIPARAHGPEPADWPRPVPWTVRFGIEELPGPHGGPGEAEDEAAGDERTPGVDVDEASGI